MRCSLNASPLSAIALLVGAIGRKRYRLGVPSDFSSWPCSKASVDRNYFNVLSTGPPTYWSTDINKIPDLLDLVL